MTRSSRDTCPLPGRRRSKSITVNEVAQLTDVTGLLVDEQDIPPMALAHQAIEMSAPESPMDAALRRVLRQMKV